MPLDTFPLLKDNTRLIRYNDTLFKLKIKYDSNTAYDKQLNERSVHHELEQVFRAVLYKNERNNPLKPIVTPSFLVKPLKIPWTFPIKNKNYKFTLYGKTLKVYEFLFEFHVSINTIDVGTIGEKEKKSGYKAKDSATVSGTVEGTNKVCTGKIDVETRDQDIEESGVKRTLRYHRSKDGNLYRESNKRGKSPVLGESNKTGKSPVLGESNKTGKSPVLGESNKRGKSPVLGESNKTGKSPVLGESNKTGKSPVLGESNKRGKSPVLGEKKVKRCNNNAESDEDAGEMETDQNNMVGEVENLYSPVRQDHRRASKRHLDQDKVGISATVSRLNNSQIRADENNSGVNKVTMQKQKSTSATKKAKHSKFSLKASELASLGHVQDSRLRNRNRVQSGISNRRTSRTLPRHTRRFSERRKIPQGRIRTKVPSVQSDMETDNDSENDSENATNYEVESNNSDTEDLSRDKRVTRNNKGKKYHDKSRNENAKNKQNRKHIDKHVYTRRSRRLRSTPSSVSSSEDNSAERSSSCDSSVDTRSPRKLQRRSTVASSESDGSPNNRRVHARNLTEERSNKSINNSRKVRLYATRNSPHAIGKSGNGVSEITSPRVSTVRPFKRITPVRGAVHTSSQHVHKLSPRRTRQSPHDADSEVVRSQVPSQVYTDMMLTMGKDDQLTEQGKVETNEGLQVTESSKQRQPPRFHPTKQRQSPRNLSTKQCQSPRPVAAGKNKRRSSGIWGKIAGFMFGK